MSYFVFETDLDALCDRSKFANRILKLIYQKHNGDMEKSMEEAMPFFEDFEEYIRNIYELVESEIPLYAYFRLLKFGADNFGFTEDEFEKAKENTIQACKLYYI